MAQTPATATAAVDHARRARTAGAREQPDDDGRGRGRRRGARTGAAGGRLAESGDRLCGRRAQAGGSRSARRARVLRRADHSARRQAADWRATSFEKPIEQAEAARDLAAARIREHRCGARSTTCSLTERRIEVQERLAALASEAVGVTAQLFNVGAADRPDFLEAEIESRRVQLDVNRSRERAARAAARLAALSGVRDRRPGRRGRHRRGHSRARA